MITDLNSLDELIVKWGYDKGILPHPNPMAQFTKTLEEVAELGSAIQAEDRAEVMDAIGDIVVTLVMQCEAWDLTLSECVGSAYTTIAGRTGRMVDGVFVKDAH